MKTLPQWDLSAFYQRPDDPRIEKDIKNITLLSEKFEKRYREKINEESSAAIILKAVKEYERILKLSAKLAGYAFLGFSTESNNPKAGAFWQRALGIYLGAYNSLIFFELELTSLSEGRLEALLADSKFSTYAHFIHKQLAWKAHRLKEKEEQIINEKSLTGGAAFVRLFEQEHAKKKYLFKNKGKRQEMNEPQLLNLLHDKDRTVRKKAAEAFSQGLREELDLMTHIFNTLVQDKSINDRYRKFEVPEASRHLDNEIDQKTVDAMISVVESNYSIVQDFYNFKKELLGYKQLFDYDRYAPVGRSSAQIPFEKAKKIVLEAFNSFSPLYAGKAREFFEHHWIDAAPRRGKQGGAFCSSYVPDIHPYVLVNYLGSTKDVLTLAHELGHGVHASLARKQTFLNYDWPLTIAETASVFGEMIVFQSLIGIVKTKEEKLSLYIFMIENMFATVFRQTSMFLFERDLHRLRKDKGELTSAQINALWISRQKEMFGNSLLLGEDYETWWSYIPHFVRSPFYVYAYSFGELLTLSLFSQYQSQGKGFSSKYMQLLAAGGSKSPQELLAPFGIDLADVNFWQGGITLIREMIQKARELR